MINVTEIHTPIEKAAICRMVIDALPDWFGIPESNDKYVKDCQAMLFLAARSQEGTFGFMALHETSHATVDIHIMGVLPAWHRKGVGRALIEAGKALAKERGYRLIQVKTLDAAHPDEGYAKTRLFYEGMGFLPVECFPTLWGEENPCLLMIQPL